jgi:integrase
MIYKRNKTYHVDVTVNGLRYRESLETGNWQKAQHEQKELIARIMEGKAGAPAGRGSFASMPFEQALAEFVKGREGRVAERTSQIDRERSKVLVRHLGKTLVRKIDARAIRAFQDARKAEGVSGRTVNLEVTLIRQVLKRAKRWAVIADDVSTLPENQNVVGKVLTREQKLHMFRTAASKPEWDVAYCAGVLAANTTCRKVELLALRWSDVDLFARELSIERSKTEAGHRLIPLNDEAMAAFARLLKRAKVAGGGLPEHFVFPACENDNLDFEHHQKTFRTAWRSLVREAGTLAGREAARAVLQTGGRISTAKAAWKRAARPFRGFRFHDLRHQSITEMAEAGITEAAMQSIAGHLSKKMLDHYSHVRMAAKRLAVEALGGGLIVPEPDVQQAKGKAN